MCLAVDRERTEWLKRERPGELVAHKVVERAFLGSAGGPIGGRKILVSRFSNYLWGPGVHRPATHRCINGHGGTDLPPDGLVCSGAFHVYLEIKTLDLIPPRTWDAVPLEVLCHTDDLVGVDEFGAQAAFRSVTVTEEAFHRAMSDGEKPQNEQAPSSYADAATVAAKDMRQSMAAYFDAAAQVTQIDPAMTSGPGRVVQVAHPPTNVASLLPRWLVEAHAARALGKAAKFSK